MRYRGTQIDFPPICNSVVPSSGRRSEAGKGRTDGDGVVSKKGHLTSRGLVRNGDTGTLLVPLIHKLDSKEAHSNKVMCTSFHKA